MSLFCGRGQQSTNTVVFIGRTRRRKHDRRRWSQRTPVGRPPPMHAGHPADPDPGRQRLREGRPGAGTCEMRWASSVLGKAMAPCVVVTRVGSEELVASTHACQRELLAEGGRQATMSATPLGTAVAPPRSERGDRTHHRQIKTSVGGVRYRLGLSRVDALAVTQIEGGGRWRAPSSRVVRQRAHGLRAWKAFLRMRSSRLVATGPRQL